MLVNKICYYLYLLNKKYQMCSKGAGVHLDIVDMSPKIVFKMVDCGGSYDGGSW